MFQNRGCGPVVHEYQEKLKNLKLSYYDLLIYIYTKDGLLITENSKFFFYFFNAACQILLMSRMRSMSYFESEKLCIKQRKTNTTFKEKNQYWVEVGNIEYGNIENCNIEFDVK